MSKTCTLTDAEKAKIWSHDELNALKGATRRDRRNQAKLYWLGQHVLGRGNTHTTEDAIRTALKAHFDAVRAAAQPPARPRQSPAKDLQDVSVNYSAAESRVLSAQVADHGVLCDCHCSVSWVLMIVRSIIFPAYVHIYSLSFDNSYPET